MKQYVSFRQVCAVANGIAPENIKDSCFDQEMNQSVTESYYKKMSTSFQILCRICRIEPDNLKTKSGSYQCNVQNARAVAFILAKWLSSSEGKEFRKGVFSGEVLHMLERLILETMQETEHSEAEIRYQLDQFYEETCWAETAAGPEIKEDFSKMVEEYIAQNITQYRLGGEDQKFLAERLHKKLRIAVNNVFQEEKGLSICFREEREEEVTDRVLNILSDRTLAQYMSPYMDFRAVLADDDEMIKLREKISSLLSDTRLGTLKAKEKLLKQYIERKNILRKKFADDRGLDEKILGEFDQRSFSFAAPPEELFERYCEEYQNQSGLYYDLWQYGPVY